MTIRNANGQILTASAYDNPVMFTGREYDAETGLYYYRARYYHPAIGRFISPDPVTVFLQFDAIHRREESSDGVIPSIYLQARTIEEFLVWDPVRKFLQNDPAGRFLWIDPWGFNTEFNLYRYCGNNPVSFIDPSGLRRRIKQDDFWFVPPGDKKPFKKYLHKYKQKYGCGRKGKDNYPYDDLRDIYTDWLSKGRPNYPP